MSTIRDGSSARTPNAQATSAQQPGTARTLKRMSATPTTTPRLGLPLAVSLDTPRPAQPMTRPTVPPAQADRQVSLPFSPEGAPPVPGKQPDWATLLKPPDPWPANAYWPEGRAPAWSPENAQLQGAPNLSDPAAYAFLNRTPPAQAPAENAPPPAHIQMSQSPVPDGFLAPGQSPCYAQSELESLGDQLSALALRIEALEEMMEKEESLENPPTGETVARPAPAEAEKPAT